MDNIFTLILWVALGFACSYYAKQQGRSPYLWFGIGLLLGLFGLLILLSLPYFARMRLANKQNKLALTKKPITNLPLAPPSLKELAEPVHLEKLWYYLQTDNAQAGPMSFQALERDWHQGKVKSDTFIWNETLSEWTPFVQVFPSTETEKAPV